MLSKIYFELFGKNTNNVAIHAGMEGGVFAKNIEDLDICTISPNLYDIHSTKERLSISSTKRVSEWVAEFLKRF